MKEIKVDLVIGSNYGDEGKGFTVNQLSTPESIVILSNGGAQRGHTVIHNGIKHIFHHFGSGTLKGAKSYACSEFILNPLQFRREYEELKSKGIDPVLYIDKDCRVTTPFDMLKNILRSHERGKFDSTGFGILETIKRYENNENSFYLKDYISNSGDSVEKHLREIKEEYAAPYKTLPSSSLDAEKLIVEENAIIKHFMIDLAFMINHCVIKTFDEICSSFNHIIFEQGQGLALDSDYDKTEGTPTKTGSSIAFKVLDTLKDKYTFNISKYYITRSYLSRHGDGFLEGEDTTLSFVDETNMPNPYQGTIRFALFSTKTFSKTIDRIRSDINILEGSNNLVITQFNKANTDYINDFKNEFNKILISSNYSDLELYK